MNNIFSGKSLGPEGYIYNTYGKTIYLKHAVASVQTLRRYDKVRPVALFCSKEHKELLEQYSLLSLFNHIFDLPENHQSITGFKHHINRFMPFKKNLFLDGDIVWCKNPDTLWKSFSAYDFTITGNQIADNFFGGPKSISIIKDLIFRRRTRTLKRFGLTYLNRIQSGMIYAADQKLTRDVCELAQQMLDKRLQTHFRSRKEEKGRSEESCEWSLAMAMAKLNVQVYHWFQGFYSPQLDFIEHYTKYSNDFSEVSCLYYSDRFVYNLRGLKWRWLQKFLTRLLSIFPGKGDYLYVTPYCLHFGWYHQKEPLNQFSDKTWNELTN